MAQKRGLKKEESSNPGAGATPNQPKTGSKRGPRKTTYAIDLTAKKEAIDRIADLYGVKVVTVIADLAALYLAGAFAPHFSKVQGAYAADRRQREEEALREIAPLFAPASDPGEDDMTSSREPEPIPAEDDVHA